MKRLHPTDTNLTSEQIDAIIFSYWSLQDGYDCAIDLYDKEHIIPTDIMGSIKDMEKVFPWLVFEEESVN
jgi:hypothetical protein